MRKSLYSKNNSYLVVALLFVLSDGDEKNLCGAVLIPMQTEPLTKLDISSWVSLMLFFSAILKYTLLTTWIKHLTGIFTWHLYEGGL